MRLLLEPTEVLQVYRGITCRLWRGRTDAGVPVFAFVAGVAVHRDHEQAELQAGLMEAPPTADDMSATIDAIARLPKGEP